MAMSSPVVSTPASPSSAASTAAAATLSPEQVEARVFERFMQFSGFGAKEKAGEMDGACFAKLCKETNIINTVEFTEHTSSSGFAFSSSQRLSCESGCTNSG